jgi:hypothetical protein
MRKQFPLKISIDTFYKTRYYTPKPDLTRKAQRQRDYLLRKKKVLRLKKENTLDNELNDSV